MPKIAAATVAEHRARQETALLDAARELLLTGGAAAVSPAGVAAATGLARNSVYTYFRSTEQILARIVADAFAEWARRVREAVGAVDQPAARIDAYARATLALAGSGVHRVAVLAGSVLRSDASRARLAHVHHDLAAPLRAALADHGDPDPGLTAELVDGALGRAIDRLDAGDPPHEVTQLTLAFVRRAVLTAGDPGSTGTTYHQGGTVFVVVNELSVAVENRAVFEQNFGASMRGTLPGVAGLRRARLLRPDGEDRDYLSVLEFDEEAAHIAYRSSDAFRAAHNWPDHAPLDANRLTTYHAATEVDLGGQAQ